MDGWGALLGINRSDRERVEDKRRLLSRSYRGRGGGGGGRQRRRLYENSVGRGHHYDLYQRVFTLNKFGNSKPYSSK